MRQRYPAAYVAQHDGPTGPLYRVRIGPFQSEQEAQKVAQALKREGQPVFLDEVPEGQ